jgi:hypothetical protein
MIFAVELSVDENFLVEKAHPDFEPDKSYQVSDNIYYEDKETKTISFFVDAKNLTNAIDMAVQKWKNFVKYFEEHNRLPHPSEI